MNKSIYFFAVISCFVFSVISAHAGVDELGLLMHKESSKPPQGAVFEDIDTNGDGSISKAEFDAYYAKQTTKCLREMDTNKDGKVTRQEYFDAMPLLHRAIGIDSSGKGLIL